MSDLRLDQMLNDQLTSRDLFQMAQAQYQQQQNLPPQESAFQNQQQVPPVQGPPVSSLFNQGSSQDNQAFGKSSLPKMLQKIGIDDTGIALNDLGRMQLIGRLKNKFGENYNQVPDALDVLAHFDKSIDKYPMDSAKKMNQTISSGERTLKALLGGT